MNMPPITGNWGQYGNWKTLQTIVKTADPDTPPEFAFPLEPEEIITPNYLLLVGCSSPIAKPHWQFGGMLRGGYLLNQHGSAQIGEVALFSSYKIPLNYYQICFIPPNGSDFYFWKYFIPPWIWDIRIEFWYFDSDYQFLDPLMLEQIHDQTVNV